MIKSSQIKQQLYPSSGFVFKGDKGREFMSKSVKNRLCVCVSENGDITAVHCFLTGSNLSQRYGASHANQRIENWWLHFQRSFSAWVKDYFKQFVPDAYLFLTMLLIWNSFSLCIMIFFDIS